PDGAVRHCAARRNQRRCPGNLSYAGIGIAMLALIENTVRVTIRHSDSEAIASEAATASASLDESASAGQRTKPAGPGDRVMVQFPHCASESPANTARCRSARGQHCGDAALKMAKSRRIRPYFRRSGLGADLGVLPPV